MKQHIQSRASGLFQFLQKHKVSSVVVLLVLVAGGYYWHTKSAAQTSTTLYVLGQVKKGTVVSSVAGTGQVSALNQVDIKPKVSGDITEVDVVAGQTVKAGDVIARIDSRDAALNLRDAQADLTSARIALEKTKTSSVQTKDSSAVMLAKAYDDAYNTLTQVFADLSSTVDSVDAIYTDTHSPYMETEHVRGVAGSSGVQNRNTVLADYQKIRVVYEADYARYRVLNRAAHPEDVQALVTEMYTTSKNFSDVLKEIRTLLAYLQSAAGTTSTQMTTDKTTLDNRLAVANNDITSLTVAAQNIQTATDALQAAIQTYSDVSGSSDPLDVQTAQLTLTQKQNAYDRAAETYSYYTVRAPFDGVIATVAAQQAGSASSGTSLATIITTQKIATIALNEVDVAKIKPGQKVTLSFDALPDLSSTGKVLEVDALGTVTQGVVNYNVKIGLDTQEEVIKSGMSVSAAIITDSKVDVLTVPNTAIKTSANGAYVLVLDGVTASSTAGVASATPPRQVPVETGISNDTTTEIVSGLSEGQQVVVRTTTSSAAATSAATTAARTTAPSAALLLGGGGGGGIRIPRN